MTTKFTDDHEWARQDGDLITIGITSFAQEQLGEVVFVELPDVDRELSKGEEAAVVESVKAAGEVKSPISGLVVEVNDELTDSPEKINDDPTGGGWIFKVKPANNDEFSSLMDDDAYHSLVESLA